MYSSLSPSLAKNGVSLLSIISNLLANSFDKNIFCCSLFQGISPVLLASKLCAISSKVSLLHLLYNPLFASMYLSHSALYNASYFFLWSASKVIISGTSDNNWLYLSFIASSMLEKCLLYKPFCSIRNCFSYLSNSGLSGDVPSGNLSTTSFSYLLYNCCNSC